MKTIGTKSKIQSKNTHLAPTCLHLSTALWIHSFSSLYLQKSMSSSLTNIIHILVAILVLGVQ